MCSNIKLPNWLKDPLKAALIHRNLAIKTYTQYRTVMKISQFGSDFLGQSIFDQDIYKFYYSI